MNQIYRIRSADTWVQARDDYLGGMDAEAVCRRYDLGLSAFRSRARKYGWRRIDQDDPAPRGADLGIYEDVGMDDQAETARLRFVQALEHGRSLEAARWRRLWREMRTEINALNAEFFEGMEPEAIAACFGHDPDDQDDPADAPRLAAPTPSPGLTAPEKVHDVHSDFSTVHNSAGRSPRPGRQKRKASTTAPALPPDTTSPPAIA